MIYYVVYLPNGDITRAGVCPPDDIDLQASPGELVMEGVCTSTDTQYVVNGQIVDLPPRPTDSTFYHFDYEKGVWVFDSDAAADAALSTLDSLLRDGPDRISPIWWESMDAATKAVWGKYRDDLLDVPNQPGFPKTIVWPTRPDVGYRKGKL